MIGTLAHTAHSERVLNERYPMNTNMTGFRWFSKISIGRVEKITSEINKNK